jgi:hypothetical protein
MPEVRWQPLVLLRAVYAYPGPHEPLGGRGLVAASPEGLPRIGATGSVDVGVRNWNRAAQHGME